MNKTLSSIIVTVPLLLMSTVIVQADYSNAVMSLGPVGYWPLNETNVPPQIYQAHNSGTLGSLANGYYDDVYYPNSTNEALYTSGSYFTGPVPGITSDGAAAALFNGGTNDDDNAGYMVVPDINGSLEKGGVPFSAEVWVKPEGGDPNDPTGTSYASTEWTSLVEKGGGGLSYSTSGDTSGDTYGWSIELAGIYTIGYPVGWYTPGPTFYLTNACWVVDFYGGNSGQTPSLEFMVPMYEPTPQWFHLAVTYDGTNANFYTNGVLAATTLPNLEQSTNEVTEAGTGAPNTTQNYQFNSGYAPDTVNPMVIGDINPDYSLSQLGYPNTPDGTIGFNCQMFNGAMADLAFYSNTLSSATVLEHYQDATAANTALYTNDVFSANPLVFLRFNDAQSDFTQPPANFSTFPVATNYGSMATAANGLYQSGVTPDVPGAAEIGFASKTNAVQFNGFDATVDVGAGKLAGTALDPQNYSSFSLVYWFKANPADCYGRFQGIIGRGDSGWRSSMDGSGFIRWNPGNGPELASPVSYNDGAWHQVVGVADGNSGTVSLYVDGQLSSSSGGMGALSGTPYDLLIGGAPDYTSSEPSRDFAGQVAQVAFFTNALSAAQAEALFDDATDLAPVITDISPTNLTVGAAGSASFDVVASGQPVTYQWYQGSTRLSNVPGNVFGATNATLTFSNAEAGNQADYSVVVANSFGSVTSAVVSLTVLTNVDITMDLPIAETNVTLFAGGAATFSIGALGAPPITYQWYSNSLAIGGATGSSYEIANVQPPNATETYYCVARNNLNTTTSLVAQVTILPDPTNSYPMAVVAAHPVGFWRLNEGPDDGNGDDGVIAHDYWGGNNGIYTNVVIGQEGYNTGETNETSVLFGAASSTFWDCDVYAIPTNVDFSAPTNDNSDFSIEAWVKGYAQTVDAGLVSKGWGGGGEQFDLDCGNDSVSTQLHSYRFLVRDALTSGAHIVDSNVNPDDNSWHHLVGVCDESQGYIALYIDGALVGTNGIPLNSGILASSRNMLIGSRPSTETTNNNDDQFVGYIDDVAVYNYALSAAAVSNQFVSADIPASVVTQPTNTIASQNGTATFSAAVEGTPMVGYLWYDANTGQPISPAATMDGATNTTLILADVQNSDSYYLVVTNAYGTNQSATVSLTVVSGLAQIYQNPPSQSFVLEGSPLQLSVMAYGTLPLGYQWQYSPNGTVWTSLAGSGTISGAQSNVLTLAAVAMANEGYYQLILTNSYGAVTSSVAQVIVGTLPIGFNGNGLGWDANSSGLYYVPQITNGVMYLTDTNSSEVRSSFFQDPVYIGAFQASFTYQTPSDGGADGMSFCIQNEGPNALGGGGGSLGVSGITPSVELELNLYTGNAQNIGYTLLTDGLTGADGNNGNYQKPGNVKINSGDPINISMYYVNGQAEITFTDAVAATSFSASYAINIPAVVGGDTAYVGFTGADGGATSLQIITNFTFVSLVSQSIQANGTNVLISWPQFGPGYVVQESTNLLNPSWVNMTNAPVATNNEFQVIVPARKGAMFYRLSVP